MDWKYITILVFFLFGIFFLGKGITGLAIISQSCCSPVDAFCDRDAVCDKYSVNEPTLEMIDFVSGFTLLFIGYFVWRYKER